MALLSLIFHWFFVDFFAKRNRKKYVLINHCHSDTVSEYMRMHSLLCALDITGMLVLFGNCMDVRGPGQHICICFGET